MNKLYNTGDEYLMFILGCAGAAPTRNLPLLRANTKLMTCSILVLLMSPEIGSLCLPMRQEHAQL